MVKVRKDLSGQKFGKLLVLHQTEDLIQKDGRRKAMWSCLCDCGNICSVRGEYLKNGHTTSCGCYNANFNDLTGKKFGRIHVINYAGRDSKTKNALWNCQCKCGNKFTTLGVNLTRTDGIRTCVECRVIDGKNDIPTIAPWMEIFFKNKNDIHKYTYNSNKRITVKCPLCGIEKEIRVADLYKHESIGCICSDNISYPEKFVFSFLKQTGINFKYQYSPKWANRKRYDFYIPSKKIILEVDGGLGHGHTHGFGLSSEDSLKIDKLKEELAMFHDIKVIRLNAFPSTREVLISSIVNELASYFELEIINYDICHKFGLTNLTKEICDKWNSGKNITELVDIYKLSNVTIRTYLKNGSQLNWCDYDSNNEIEKNRKRLCKNIIVYKNNEFIGKYESCVEFAKQYNNLQTDVIINPLSVANASRKNKLYKGFKIMEVNNV